MSVCILHFFFFSFNFRLFNDLLLWENTSVTSASAFEHSNFKVHVPGLDDTFPKRSSQDQFPIFKPFVNGNLIYIMLFYNVNLLLIKDI